MYCLKCFNLARGHSSFLGMAMRFNTIKNNFKVVIMLYNFYGIILNISHNYMLMSQNIF